MIIKSTKDIPDEIKNIVELYYVRSPEMAMSQARDLEVQHPEMRDLTDCVLKLMGHAPESVFMFYDELITLYSNSGAREDIPLSVDDLMGDGNVIEDLGPLDIPLLDALSLDVEDSLGKDSSQIDSAFSSILSGIPSSDEQSISSAGGKSGIKKPIPSLLPGSALSDIKPDSERVSKRAASSHAKTISPEDNLRLSPGLERQQAQTFREGDLDIDIDLNFDSIPSDFDLKRGALGNERRGVHAKETAAALQPVPGELFAGFVNTMRNPNSPTADANSALTPVPSASLSDIMKSSRRAQAFGDSSPSALSSSYLDKINNEDKNNETRPNMGALNPYLSDSGRPLKMGGIIENSRPTLQNLPPVQQSTKKLDEGRPTMAALSPVLPPTASTASPDSLEPLSRIPRLKCSMADISQRTDVNPRAGFILSLIDGFTSIADILDISAWPEPETAFILLELQQQGIIDFG